MSIKLAAISGPRIADTNFTDTGIFLERLNINTFTRSSCSVCTRPFFLPPLLAVPPFPLVWATLAPFFGPEKGTQTQTFWSGYFRVGWGSSTWTGGGQKVRYVPRNQGNQTFWAGYPGILLGYPGSTRKVWEKKVCVQFPFPIFPPQKVLCSVERRAQHRAWWGAVSGWTSAQSSGRKFLPEICVKKGQISLLSKRLPTEKKVGNYLSENYRFHSGSTIFRIISLNDLQIYSIYFQLP